MTHALAFLAGILIGPFAYRLLFRVIDHANNWRWENRRLARWPRPQ